jgi:hypothetical protein
MPGAQPRGTYSFNPSSSSRASETQALDSVNAENNGEEDQAGSFAADTPMENMPAVFTLMMSHSPPDPQADTVSLRGTSQSHAMPPPFSSSISPTTHSDRASHPPKRHFSANSAKPSHTTSSETQTTSAGTGSKRKRKHNASEDMPPPTRSLKRASRNKTKTLNPVIISSQLNATLSHVADVMVKSLDVAATPVDASAAPPSQSSSHASSIPSQLLTPPSAPSSLLSSDSEVLDKALGIVTADKVFSEDNLLTASLLFSNTSNEVVRIA